MFLNVTLSSIMRIILAITIIAILVLGVMRVMNFG